MSKSCYHLSPGYRKVTFWHFDPLTGERMSTSSMECDKTEGRKERYTLCCDEIESEGYPRPKYKPLSRHADRE